MPTISIIVPIYNAEKYLGKCLNSLISQTYKDIEIILVDDGSTDLSLKRCEFYAQQDNRIKIISQENQGPSVARNNGLKQATGKYIGFVDSDDYVQPNTYELALKYMEDENTDLVAWGVKVVTDDKSCYVNWFEKYYFKQKYFGNTQKEDVDLFKIPVVPWNKLYKASIIKENDITFPVGKLYEDDSFWWKYVALCKNIFFMKEILHFYNLRNTSLRGEVIHKKVDCEVDRISMVEDVFDFYQKHNLEDKNLLDKLFLVSFISAHNETSDKTRILKAAQKLVGKMNLLDSSNSDIVELANGLNKKIKELECGNVKVDEFEILNKDLSEEDVSKLVENIKNDVKYIKDRDNLAFDSCIVDEKLEKSVKSLDLLIENSMKKLSLQDEFSYLKDFYFEYPEKFSSEMYLEALEGMLCFLEKLYEVGLHDDVLKFAKIAKMIYPKEIEFYRIIGDVYYFSKKKLDVALFYYYKYTQQKTKNYRVYEIMSNIYFENGDVFNSLLCKVKANYLRANL